MREPKEILINGKTLEKILENHKHWINRDCEDWRNMKANLSGADLSGANLLCANLLYADLSGADLYGADLSGADLSGTNLLCANLLYADLSGADLYGADLSGANLSGANLSDAYLRNAYLINAKLIGANLSCAYLRGADLINANLRGADLSCANLRNANFSGADLRDANLRYTNLSGADLDKEEQIRKGVKLSNPITGWKKCKDGVIVKLEIPRGAIVFSINNHKCRTDKAIVKEIIGSDRAFSMHKYFSYYVGDKIEVYNFNCEYNIECAEGIHFFRTRKEAENY